MTTGEPLFTAITSWAPYMVHGRDRLAGRPERQKQYIMKLKNDSVENFELHRIAIKKEADQRTAIATDAVAAERIRITLCIDAVLKKFDPKIGGHSAVISTLKAIRDNFVNTP